MIVVRRGVQRDPDRVQQEMEQVFRALMPARPRVAARQSGLWRPPLEVYETDQALVIIAEVAGLDERQLSVVVDQDVLAIRGERPDPCQAEKRSYREVGIPYGAFGADVYVPFPIDADETVAEYQNGFLRIVLPKAAPRTIVPRRPEQDGRGKGAH
jgi:HSP20 family protein